MNFRLVRIYTTWRRVLWIYGRGWADQYLKSALGQYHRITEKKSLQSSFGAIEISNSNPLLQVQDGFRISPLLSEKIAYIGQLDTYEKGSEIALQLLNLAVSDSRIYRLTDQLGKQAQPWLEENNLRDKVEEEQIVYVQLDGSMLLTREEHWKEVKLGRVFGANDLCAETDFRNWLKNSEYVAHLGGHEVFEERMSAMLDAYEDRADNLVFINDGAKWQWNWITDCYPRATQILDYYHAMEHIGSYVRLARFPVGEKETEKLELTERLGHVLKHQGLQACRKLIDQIGCQTKVQRSEKKKLDQYLDNNAERMKYPEYLKRGLLIGSGAIESAHRTVIQRRMKLSGQRWSKKGARRMLNLRTLNMSGHWDRVRKFYQTAA